MTSTAGAYAVAGFCSSDCYRRFRATSASSDLEPLARAVSGAQKVERAASCRPEQPYLGPSFDLRFEPVAYGGAVIVALPPVETMPARPAPPGPPPKPPVPEKPPPRRRVPPPQPTPEFVPSLGAEPAEETPYRSSHKARIAVIASVFVVAIVFWFIFRGQTASTSQPVGDVADSSWDSGWGRTPDGGEIQLYKPSAGWTDYRLEARISRFLGVEWVCRAADAGNYYLIRLTPGRYRNVMRLHRTAIEQGRAGAETQADVPVAEGRGDDVAALLEVRGDKFRLFLGGVRAATWTDARLVHGGAGKVVTNGAQRIGATRITRLEPGEVPK